jgi:hypothetical protein
LKTRFVFYGCVVAALVIYVLYATSMPGTSYSGPLPAATPALLDLDARLHEHVTTLASRIGVRNVERTRHLIAAREYLASKLTPLVTSSNRLQFEDVGLAGGHAQNVIFEVLGTNRQRIVLVGAHYDSVDSSPGANDNASGVAAVLELAGSFARRPAAQTLRFVLFANEEPPYFKNPGMGSRVDADNARQRGDNIAAMLSLETIGYYSDAPDSQHYPWPVGLLYPSRGNFLGFVGDFGSRSLVRSAIRAFRRTERFPSQGAALPSTFPGVDWSDHWSFRQAGYPAIMITDTALYRDANYHQASDTPEKLDYERLARVTRGLETMIRALVQ